jgi:hypothetical protein
MAVFGRFNPLSGSPMAEASDEFDDITLAGFSRRHKNTILLKKVGMPPAPMPMAEEKHRRREVQSRPECGACQRGGEVPKMKKERHHVLLYMA